MSYIVRLTLYMLSKMVKSLQRVAENVLHCTSYIAHAQ